MMSLKKLVENAINQNDTEHSVFIAVCNAHVALQRENPLFFESMINSQTKKSEDEPIYKNMLKLNDDINKILCDFIDRGITNKSFRPDIDTKETVFALWSSICGVILISYNKQSYLQYLETSRLEFLEKAFNTLYKAISI